MNSREDLKYLFNLYQPEEQSNYKRILYNQNSYLNLEFDTVDNIYFNFNNQDISESIGITFPTDVLNAISQMTSENYDSDYIGHLAYADNITTQSGRSYYDDLVRLEALTENFKSIIIKETNTDYLLNNINEALKEIKLQKDFIEKSALIHGKIINMTMMLNRNNASFETEELDFFLDKLKQQIEINKEYIGERSIDNIKKFQIEIKNKLKIINDTTKEFIEIKKFLDIESNYASYADRLVEYSLKNTPISQFLTNKIIENNIQVKLEFKGNATNDSIYILTDNSILIRNKKGEYNIVKNQDDFEILINQIIKDSYSMELPNKPKLISFISNKVKEEYNRYYEFENGLSLCQTIRENEQILKNANINILDFNNKDLEVIDDSLNKSIKEYKINKFMNAILSNKYKHLLSKESEPYWKELYEKNLTEKDLQEYVGKKLAALKTPEDLTKMLEKLFNQLNGFYPEATNKKLEKWGLEPVINRDNVIVIEVSTHAQCVDFGSPSWCIHRHESYFKQYTSDNAKQFILYNYDKDSKDNYSMIGFTIKKDGTLTTQHLKNDDYVNFDNNDFLNKIYKEVAFKVVPEELLVNKLKEEYLKLKTNKQIGIKL